MWPSSLLLYLKTIDYVIFEETLKCPVADHCRLLYPRLTTSLQLIPAWGLRKATSGRRRSIWAPSGTTRSTTTNARLAGRRSYELEYDSQTTHFGFKPAEQ
ncbi:hypothetical protein VTK73DRAFT_8862 [Phialemonium thermophilum]|uniref:Uncharacterized protein n=1 Tax=Phialemonium thermophilum TaxID=223376 RepID=A0ABR3W5W9_9PEZI